MFRSSKKETKKQLIVADFLWLTPFLLFRLRGSFPFSASEDRVPLILPLPPKQCYQTRGQKTAFGQKGGKVPSPRKGDVNLESTKRNIQQFFAISKERTPRR